MYRRLRAFSPVELLVIVAVLALIVAILLPSCTRARELSKRAVCAANLRGIAQGMYIYAQDGDLFPVMTAPSPGSGAAYFGYRKTHPGRNDTPSPTADMWAIVHDNSSTPKQFVCPSTTDQPDPVQDTFSIFDFMTAKNLSYAYQYMHDPDFKPLSTASDPTLPLVGDANPYIKGGVKIEPAADRQSSSRGNSRNHANREGENIVFVDAHVDFNKGPDVGLPGKSDVPQRVLPRQRDNAYTLHAKGSPVDAGTTRGLPDTVDLGDKSDSCLVP